MTFSAAGGHDASRFAGQRWREPASSPDNPPPSLLEDVVRQTLSGTGETAVDQKLLNALRSVAARHRGSGLALDPMVTELVEVVLHHEFARDGRSAELWRDMTRRIAETLWDSPICRERLNDLWNHLSEG